MTTDRPSPAGSPAEQIASPEPTSRDGAEALADGLMWLRFDDRPFTIGDTITPAGYLPPEWEDLYDRGHLRTDRVYIVRAAGPDQVPRASWNEPGRWCYQVDPQLPLEQDPDRTHRFMPSRMCRTATVVSILRTPQAG